MHSPTPLRLAPLCSQGEDPLGETLSAPSPCHGTTGIAPISPSRVGSDTDAVGDGSSECGDAFGQGSCERASCTELDEGGGACGERHHLNSDGGASSTSSGVDVGASSSDVTLDGPLTSQGLPSPRATGTMRNSFY